MIHNCAWCKKVIKEDSGKSQPITHGICKHCLIDMKYPKIGLKMLIDKKAFPIVLVDANETVISANMMALEILGWSENEVENKTWREVMRCIYWDSPDGCGKNIHCTGCTINTIVMETHATGISSIKVPAYQYMRDKTNYLKKMYVVITTELVNDVVLLQIDDIILADDVVMGK